MFMSKATDVFESLQLGGISQGTSLFTSHLGRCFVSMPSNQPSLIVLTLKLAHTLGYPSPGKGNASQSAMGCMLH